MWLSPPAASTPKYQFINRGISFQTSEQILARFEQDVAAMHPTALVVEMGVNDLKCIPLFPERRDQIIERLKQNVRTLVDRSATLGIELVLVTIFPLADVPLYRRPFWSSDVAASISIMNHFLETLVSRHVQVLEVDDLLLDKSGAYRRSFSLDMLH